MPGAYWVDADLDFIDQISARAENSIIIIGPSRASCLSAAGVGLLSFNAPFSSFLTKVSDFLKNFSNDFSQVGIVQGFSFSISRPVVSIYSVGSNTPAFVNQLSPQGIIQLNRIVTSAGNFEYLIKQQVGEDNSLGNLLQIKTPFFKVKISNPFFANEYSDVISENTATKPFGIGLICYSEMTSNPIAKIYFEECKIVNVGSSLIVGQSLMSENVSVMCHRRVVL